MNTVSPLRYPGGKAAMHGLLSEIRSMNRLGDRAIAEPYAGGAGASLNLLVLEDTHRILINDLDGAIHDFWRSLLRQGRRFLELLASTPVSIEEWRRQRDIYRGVTRSSSLARGFAAFYLNRCNRSGVITNGGPIGGIEQAGKWKIDARFNRQDLAERCQTIIEYRDRIALHNQDGETFVAANDTASVFFFIDPPYFHKGDTLYLNAMTPAHHASLAATLRGVTQAAWVLTYDDCPEIRDLYSGWANVRPYRLRYSAHARRSGTELLITPKGLHLPAAQCSLAVEW